MKSKSDQYVDYFKRTIAQEVNIHGIEKFCDFNSRDKMSLIDDFEKFITELIKEESFKQNGRSLS